jgi:hypothetical protein
MEAMSEREYSAHSNLSCGAIQKACKANHSAIYGNGDRYAPG